MKACNGWKCQSGSDHSTVCRATTGGLGSWWHLKDFFKARLCHSNRSRSVEVDLDDYQFKDLVWHSGRVYSNARAEPMSLYEREGRRVGGECRGYALRVNQNHGRVFSLRNSTVFAYEESLASRETRRV